MNKKILIMLIAAGVVALVGGFFLSSPQNTDRTEADNNLMVREEPADVMVREDTMVKEDDDDAMINDNETMIKADSSYVAYSPDYLEKYQGKTKVLFFHASWCPTCTAVDKEINEKLESIPEELVIIKTNYDSESDLKQKYGITYQHTFVLVDDEGNELDKWNGGGLDEIVERI
jgi:thiol-disulfide isomerase/thioredoxin